MRQLLLGIAIIVFAAIALAHHDEKRDGYAVVIGDVSHTTNLDLDTLLKARKSTSGDFIWVRRDGAAYWITDAEILRVARGLMREFEPITAEQDALHEKMKPFERREDEIEDEVDALESRIEQSGLSESELRKLERQMRELESKLRKVEEDLRALERIERDIERRHDVIEDRVDREIERLIDRAFRQGAAVRTQRNW